MNSNGIFLERNWVYHSQKLSILTAICFNNHDEKWDLVETECLSDIKVGMLW